MNPETGRDTLALTERIQAALESAPFRPWCIHRLYERVSDPDGSFDREVGLLETERAADALAMTGKARREYVSALSIGVRCQDTVYWSGRSNKRKLDEFGPEYESPTILHRLASHFRCHGL